MDLPFHSALKEAQNKLNHTYCIVNGKLVLLFEIHEDSLIFSYDGKVLKELKGDEVETFETWLPNSGIYLVDDKYIFYVRKQPVRQWLKSFSYNYYDIKCLSLAKGKFDGTELVNKIFTATMLHNGIWKNGEYIMYLDSIIAKMDTELIIINPLYEQEIKEAIIRGEI